MGNSMTLNQQHIILDAELEKMIIYGALDQKRRMTFRECERRDLVKMVVKFKILKDQRLSCQTAISEKLYNMCRYLANRL